MFSGGVMITSFLHRLLASKPYLVSISLFILLCLWISLGDSSGNKVSDSSAIQPPPLVKVFIRRFSAQPTYKEIELYGRSDAQKRATLSAEIAGKISHIYVKKGEWVELGDSIVGIDKGDLKSQLETAKALLKVKDKEYLAARALQKKGLSGEIAFAHAQAQLIEANFQVSKAELALKNTEIKAPFSGFVNDFSIELGDFVALGDPVASLVDLSKLVIVADVSEKNIHEIELGQVALVRLLDGNQKQGIVSYISRTSNPSTNTFPIEIELPNPNYLISAGVSAEIYLRLGREIAIKVTPSVLALNEAGDIGIKIVESEYVKFVPIRLLKAESDGVWLSGIGPYADIITRGQGFVRDGDQVIAISE